MLCFFFFNDTATTEIYTLSLHDALPIWAEGGRGFDEGGRGWKESPDGGRGVLVPPGILRDWPAWILLGSLMLLALADRKSTRLNSSHANISYAVFCLKKKTDEGLESCPE